MGIKIKKKKKIRRWQKNSGAIFEKRGAIMGWEELLKRSRNARGIAPKDIKTLNYILRNGDFKTVDRIVDEIYDLITENKKLGARRISQIEGRPLAIRLEVGKQEIKRYMTTSPAYESRDSGNRDHRRLPIMEYRYIGE